jgi:chorismate mutase
MAAGNAHGLDDDAADDVDPAAPGRARSAGERLARLRERDKVRAHSRTLLQALRDRVEAAVDVAHEQAERGLDVHVAARHAFVRSELRPGAEAHLGEARVVLGVQVHDARAAAHGAFLQRLAHDAFEIVVAAADLAPHEHARDLDRQLGRRTRQRSTRFLFERAQVLDGALETRCGFHEARRTSGLEGARLQRGLGVRTVRDDARCVDPAGERNDGALTRQARRLRGWGGTRPTRSGRGCS